RPRRSSKCSSRWTAMWRRASCSAAHYRPTSSTGGSRPALEATAERETPGVVAPSLAGSLELTFEDGPDPVWTPAVLAALRGSPLRATFFVVATRVGEH